MNARRYRVAVAAVLAGVLSAPAVADAPMPLGGTGVAGGPGGGGFVLMCPPDAFLIGLDVRTGAWIDAVGPACGVVDRARMQVTHAVPGLPQAGGAGGDAQRDMRCEEANSVIFQLDVFLARTGGGTFVGNLQAGCHPLHKNGYSTTQFARWGETPHEGSARLVCPDGQLARGVYGTAGIYIDSIGLVCAPAPLRVVAKPKVESDLIIRDSDMFKEQIDPGAIIKAQPQALVNPVFHNPTVNGVAVDFCLNWAENCGKPAADAFCQSQGFAQSSKHTVQENAPPTFVIGDGVVCSESYCARLSSITCRR
jgi:hypothetical protein